MRDIAGTPEDIFFIFIGQPELLTEAERRPNVFGDNLEPVRRAIEKLARWLPPQEIADRQREKTAAAEPHRARGFVRCLQEAVVDRDRRFHVTTRSYTIVGAWR